MSRQQLDLPSGEQGKFQPAVGKCVPAHHERARGHWRPTKNASHPGHMAEILCSAGTYSSAFVCRRPADRFSSPVSCRARSAILGSIQTERTAALHAVFARRASRCSARSAVVGVSVVRRAGSVLPRETARTARQGLTRMGAERRACCAPKVNSALLLVLAISRRARTALRGGIRRRLEYQTYLVAQIAARENTERWRDLLTLRHAKIVAVDDFRH